MIDIVGIWKGCAGGGGVVDVRAERCGAVCVASGVSVVTALGRVRVPVWGRDLIGGSAVYRMGDPLGLNMRV